MQTPLSPRQVSGGSFLQGLKEVRPFLPDELTPEIERFENYLYFLQKRFEANKGKPTVCYDYCCYCSLTITIDGIYGNLWDNSKTLLKTSPQDSALAPLQSG